MKKRNICILLLICVFLLFSNVYAVEENSVYSNQSVEETNEDSEYLPPVDISGYDIDDDVSLEGGGTYYPYEIWTFRIVIVLIIGSVIILCKKIIDKKKTQESDF